MASASPCPFIRGMAVKGPGRREFAQFVAHHVLGHHNGDMLHAVVDGKGQANELRQDRRTA